MPIYFHDGCVPYWHFVKISIVHERPLGKARDESERIGENRLKYPRLERVVRGAYGLGGYPARDCDIIT